MKVYFQKSIPFLPVFLAWRNRCTATDIGDQYIQSTKEGGRLCDEVTAFVIDGQICNYNVGIRYRFLCLL